jgi:hypothetical protein
MAEIIMKRQFFFGLLSIFLVVALSGCIGETGASGAGNAIMENQSGGSLQSQDKAVAKIEIYHFHRTQQCSSCIRLGELAEETVNAYFTAELESGKIIFGHINIDLPENKEIVDRYSPAGSSIFIGTYYEDGTFSKEENVQVWYKIGSKEEYLSYLGELVNRKFTGK